MSKADAKAYRQGYDAGWKAANKAYDDKKTADSKAVKEELIVAKKEYNADRAKADRRIQAQTRSKRKRAR